MSRKLTGALLRESLAPLRSAGFTRFLISQTISVTGTAAARVALIWYVLQDLGDVAALGLVLLAFTAPQFFMGIVGGVLADRYSRKMLAVGSDFASAAIFFVMWLLATWDALSLGPLVVLLVLAGLSTSVFGPSAGAMIPQLVERSGVRQANALRLFLDQFAGIVAPALAGFTLGTTGAAAWFLVNAVSFAVAAFLFLPTRVPPVAHRDDRSARGLLFDVGEAIKTIGRVPWLRAGVLAGGVANLLVVAPLMILVPAIVEQQSLGSEALGLYFTLFSIGTVVGVVLAGSLVSERRQLESALGGLIAGGILVAGIGLFPALIPLLIFALAAGIVLAVYEVLWNAYEQTNVGDSILARVLAGDAWLSFAARSAGLSVIGFLPEVSPPTTTLVVCGLGFTLIVAMLLLQLRRARRDYPDGHDPEWLHAPPRQAGPSESR